jgi:hypothetical protein
MHTDASLKTLRSGKAQEPNSAKGCSFATGIPLDLANLLDRANQRSLQSLAVLLNVGFLVPLTVIEYALRILQNPTDNICESVHRPHGSIQRTSFDDGALEHCDEYSL